MFCGSCSPRTIASTASGFVNRLYGTRLAAWEDGFGSLSYSLNSRVLIVTLLLSLVNLTDDFSCFMEL